MARYYRNNYRRTYATTTVSDGFCTDKQHDTIIRLATLADKADTLVDGDYLAAVTALIGNIDQVTLGNLISSDLVEAHDGTKKPRWRTIPVREASKVIDALKAVEAVIKSSPSVLAAEAAKYPGLPAHNRTMPTKYDGKCVSCGTVTVAGTDLAVLVGDRWQSWCQACATTSPAERQARVDAERAALDAEAARVAAESKHLFDLCCQVVEASGTDASKPVIGVAIPSKGSNDLDFLKVVHDGRVYRVIGGHPDQRLAVDQAVTLVERVLALGVRDAIVRYGQELGHCGVCGRHLTDDESRQRGIGPICASRW